MNGAEFRDLAVEEFDTRTLMRHAGEQAVKRRYDEFLIVDIDSHHYESDHFHEILEYIEDPVLRHQARYQGFRGNGLMTTDGKFQELAGRITRYPGRAKEKTPPGQHRDLTLAHRWMDAMGVDIACLFPTPMLTFGSVPRLETEVQLSRAYCRWLTERLLREDDRIRSMLYLPFNEPEACEAIVEEFGDKKGVIGFVVTARHYRSVQHNSYMRLYAMLQERKMPLAFHAAFDWGEQSLALTNRFISAHALGFTWSNMLHLTNWIVNGLPERFPGLKTIWIESGLAWVPFLMQRLDHEYMMRSSECPLLKMKPSEYMRQMYFTSQPMEMVDNRKALELTFEMINAETQLLYASDYPHWDMDLPSTIYDLPFLSETAKRNILGGNAARLFGLGDARAPAKLAGPAQ